MVSVLFVCGGELAATVVVPGRCCGWKYVVQTAVLYEGSFFSTTTTELRVTPGIPLYTHFLHLMVVVFHFSRTFRNICTSYFHFDIQK